MKKAWWEELDEDSDDIASIIEWLGKPKKRKKQFSPTEKEKKWRRLLRIG